LPFSDTAGKSVLEAAMEGAKSKVSSYSNDIVCFYCRFTTISVFATGPGKMVIELLNSRSRGCLLVPFVVYCYSGLYYIFGRIAEIQAGKSEEENPLTEE
jgi:hypothetical protein